MFGECVQCWGGLNKKGLARGPQATYKLRIREVFSVLEFNLTNKDLSLSFVH